MACFSILSSKNRSSADLTNKTFRWYSAKLSDLKKFKDSGVNRLLLVFAGPRCKGTYANLAKLVSKLDSHLSSSDVFVRI